jgi:hypothetical protein
MVTNRRAAHNSTFAIGGVFPLERDRLCSADSFVVAESFVLCINICGENPPPLPSEVGVGQILKTKIWE